MVRRSSVLTHRAPFGIYFTRTRCGIVGIKQIASWAPSARVRAFFGLAHADLEVDAVQPWIRVHDARRHTGEHGAVVVRGDCVGRHVVTAGLS